MDHVSALQILSKRVGRRVKAITLYDGNVCDYKRDANFTPTALKGFPFSYELRFSHEGRRVTILANAEYICIQIKSKVDLPVICSINRDNKIDFMTQTNLRVSNHPRWPVFLRRGDEPSDTLRSFLKSPIMLEATDQLVRNESESFHIRADEVAVYSKSLSVDDLLRAVENISLLLDECEASGVSRTSDFYQLPERFHDLTPLIERWAEPDDSARDALLDEAGDSELRELVRVIRPRFQEINQYLSSFGEKPLPEAATALGTLAECATEAQLKLSQSAERD